MMPRPKFDFDNVFVIGFNKTGTTSANRFLQNLGLKHLSINRHVKARWEKKDYDYLIWLTGRFNSFDDVPWNRNDVIERLMPLDRDSRFILTVRDPDQWFDSYVRFEARRFPPAESDRSKMIDFRLERDELCRTLAKKYGRQLLEIDVTRETEANLAIGQFLGFKDNEIPEFPHLNRTQG